MAKTTDFVCDGFPTVSVTRVDGEHYVRIAQQGDEKEIAWFHDGHDALIFDPFAEELRALLEPGYQWIDWPAVVAAHGINVALLRAQFPTEDGQFERHEIHPPRS